MIDRLHHTATSLTLLFAAIHSLANASATDSTSMLATGTAPTVNTTAHSSSPYLLLQRDEEQNAEQNQNDEQEIDLNKIVNQISNTIVYKPLTDTVAIENPMPQSFLGVHRNIIINEEKLNPFFDRLCAMASPARIVHIGDSHLRGHVWPAAIRGMLEKAFGQQAMQPQEITYKTTAIANETGLPGVVYHAWGKNGATCSYFNTPERLEKIKLLQPDLLVLSFGTNEAHVDQYSANAHLTQLSELVKQLRMECPRAVILLTTPPGAYKCNTTHHKSRVKNKKGRWITKTATHRDYYVNPQTPWAVNTITQYARENNMPLWDLYHIVGGKNYACINWQKGNYMKGDHVHYQAQGYELQGKLFATAFLKSFNHYITRRKNNEPAH